MRNDVAVRHVRTQLEDNGHRLVRRAPRCFAVERKSARIVKASRDDFGDRAGKDVYSVKVK